MRGLTQTRKKGIATALGASGLSLAIVAVVSNVDLAGFVAALHHLGAATLLTVAIVFGLAYCSEAWRIQSLAAVASCSLPFRSALLAAIGGLFLTNISPFYLGAGGLYAALLVRRGLTWKQGLSIVVVGAVFNYVIHLGLASAILIAGVDFSATVFTPLPSLRWYLLGLYLSAFGSLVTLLALMAQRWDPPSKLGRLGGAMRCLFATIRQTFRSHRRQLISLGMASSAHFLTFYGVAPIILNALDPGARWWLLYPLQVGTFSLAVLTPTPGASGGVELLAVPALMRLTTAAEAGTVIVLWRLITYHGALAVGAFALTALYVIESIREEDVSKAQKWSLKAVGTEQLCDSDTGKVEDSK